MPAVNLPNGQSAILFSKDEVTERTARNISRAYLKAAGAALKIAKLGFDEQKPETWGVMSDIDDDDREALDGYQAALIAGMVKQWTLGDLPTAETALDLPRATFVALADACGEEFNRTDDFDPHIDPKAPTAGSSD
jgi:hypothetical protein